MKELAVYILLCSDGTYYTGVTNDVNRRMYEHHLGLHENSYTFSRRPLVLKYVTWIGPPIEAIYFEKRIKKWSQAKKEALINGRFDDLPLLSKKKS